MKEMPVFVKVDDYKDALDVMSMIKEKIENARKTLNKINELKREEDTEIELWNSAVTEIERKINFVDKTLSEPEAL